MRWCHKGQLDGGLSVSLRATPDEAFGGVVKLLGAKLKLLDVRVRPNEPMELQVEYPLGEELKVERWAVEDVPGLVHNLNDLFRARPEVKAGVVLGEFDDMWQLWAVEKTLLAELLQQRWFEPRNRRALEGPQESDW
ncbi:MAG: hypothetical protein QM723_24765 [Myxococcaceae bacterium]